MKLIPNKIKEDKFVVLFQERSDLDKDPEWIIGVKLGTTFNFENDKEDPFVFNVILPKKEYQQFKNWSELCSYETNLHKTKNFTWFNVKVSMYDSFLNMLSRIKRKLNDH